MSNEMKNIVKKQKIFSVRIKASSFTVGKQNPKGLPFRSDWIMPVFKSIQE